MQAKYIEKRALKDGTEYDSFNFACRWCSFRGIVGAAIHLREWPWQCPGCSRKYIHWHPGDGEPLVPTLVPYGRAVRSGRPPQARPPLGVPRLRPDRPPRPDV